MENENPTVLNATDLPTRRAGLASSKEGTSCLSAILDSNYYYRHDPFDLPSPESDLSDSDGDDNTIEPIDAQEIYDLISTISDPEHPLSLGSLSVVNLPDIHLTPSPETSKPNELITVLVEITPTVTHCSLATVIGLGVRVRLEQSLPPNFRVDIRIKEGTHSQDDQVNKQLADKERVAAAMENATLMGVLKKMLETCQ